MLQKTHYSMIAHLGTQCIPDVVVHDRPGKESVTTIRLDDITLTCSLEKAEQIAKAILSQLQQKQQQEMEEGEVSF